MTAVLTSYPAQVAMRPVWRTRYTCAKGLSWAEKRRGWLLDDMALEDEAACTPPNVPLDPPRVVN